jgi:hypothetical protein
VITYCGICREQIPLERQRRGARTCSVDCQKAYRAARREEWMKSHCKLLWPETWGQEIDTEQCSRGIA